MKIIFNEQNRRSRIGVFKCLRFRFTCLSCRSAVYRPRNAEKADNRKTMMTSNTILVRLRNTPPSRSYSISLNVVTPSGMLWPRCRACSVDILSVSLFRHRTVTGNNIYQHDIIKITGIIIFVLTEHNVIRYFVVVVVVVVVLFKDLLVVEKKQKII